MLKEWLTRLRFLVAPKGRREIDEEQIQANLTARMTSTSGHRNRSGSRGR
jgi:hypothetical protein